MHLIDMTLEEKVADLVGEKVEKLKIENVSVYENGNLTYCKALTATKVFDVSIDVTGNGMDTIFAEYERKNINKKILRKYFGSSAIIEAPQIKLVKKKQLKVEQTDIFEFMEGS